MNSVEPPILTVNGPVILWLPLTNTLPVNSCVLAVVDPLRVDPVTNSIDEVMV